MLRAHLERSGGFAGLRASADVNSESLSSDETQHLRQLVDAAEFFKLPETIRAKNPGADRFQYKITIEDDQQTHTVVVDEAAMPTELRPLIQWLSSRTRR